MAVLVGATLVEVTNRDSSPESSPTASSNDTDIEAMLFVGTNDGAKLKEIFSLDGSAVTLVFVADPLE